MNNLHQAQFFIKKYGVLSLLGLVLVLGGIAVFQGVNSDSQNTVASPTPYAMRESTPYPKITNPPMQIDNDERIVANNPLPLVSYPLKTGFAAVPENEYPEIYNKQTTRYYSKVVNGVTEYLRVSVTTNGDGKTLKEFTDDATGAYSKISQKYYKFRDHVAVDTFFKGNDGKSIVMHTTVYAPGFFHTLSYSKEFPPETSQIQYTQELETFMKDFMAGYDWATVFYLSKSNVLPNQADIDIKNERDVRNSQNNPQ